MLVLFLPSVLPTSSLSFWSSEKKKTLAVSTAIDRINELPSSSTVYRGPIGLYIIQAVVTFLWCYPFFGLIYEINKGIMSKETVSNVQCYGGGRSEINDKGEVTMLCCNDACIFVDLLPRSCQSIMFPSTSIDFFIWFPLQFVLDLSPS